MRDRPNEFLASATPEEVAKQEQHLINDVRRINRMNLVKLAYEMAEEHPDSEEMKQVVDHLVEIIALYKRSSITLKVLTKRLHKRLEES
jgi:hypothetical protein